MRNRFRRGSLALLLLLVGATVLAQTAAVGPPPDLDAWVARSMKEFGVPGFSRHCERRQSRRLKGVRRAQTRREYAREREHSVRHWLEH